MRKAETLSIFSFMEKFPDEASAVTFFEKQIWGEAPICPYCDSKNTAKRVNRHGHRCRSCRKDFTVRIGTIFENSRLKLHKWLYAMYLVVTSRKGISGLQLSKKIGVTPKTAWFMLQRLRQACIAESSAMLKGIVKADEVYLGGKEKNKHASKRVKGTQGRSTRTTKLLVAQELLIVAVVGLRERGGQVKAKAFSGITLSNMQELINQNTERGSVLCTDEARFHRPVTGYQKLVVNHSMSEFVNGMASTNGIESVWAVLKRGYHGTFHHFSKKHVDRYVNEFTFRLNQGNCQIDTVDRMKSLIATSVGKHISYRELIV